MAKPVALVTHACEFAGSAAVAALHAAGFHVVAHDLSFADAAVREVYTAAHRDVVAQSPTRPVLRSMR
ncbi:MAG: hypothetical protein HC876_20345 [Chloroflexaceae bacterium]|nr:hypothetical protein [Chloroflexaceae bacterium]